MYGRGLLRTVKARALGRGAMLGIVSPASLANAEAVARGVSGLERVGYRTRVFPHALDQGPLNFAGRVEDRVADVHAAFADEEVDGIVCTRGGWGCAELLPLLDRKLIAANPKVFVGYSDVTSLHVWLRREVGLVTFQGPMVASDWSKEPGPEMGSWAAAMEGASGSAVPVRVLRGGRAEGVLTGGCLSIYVEALGTPYAAEAQGGVLFLEDVGTKPYQWDRMLRHLRYAGALEGVTGIVFGDMGECGPEEEIAASLLHSLRDFEGPVGIGLRSGHVSGGNVTVPFGVRVRLELEGEHPRVDFVEAAVEG